MVIAYKICGMHEHMALTGSRSGYTRQHVASITGLTARQLTYWRQTGLIVPSHQTQGGHARYNFTDLIALKTVKRLLEQGVSTQKIRKSILALTQYLPQQSHPLSELKLVATGDVVLVFHQGMAIEAISGQEWILEVAELEKEVTLEVQHALPEAELVVDQQDLFTEKPEQSIAG